MECRDGLREGQRGLRELLRPSGHNWRITRCVTLTQIPKPSPHGEAKTPDSWTTISKTPDSWTTITGTITWPFS